MGSRRGSAVNCAHDRSVRTARVVRNARSASPVVHGFQNRLEWPRAPRRARSLGGAEEGLGNRCARFFGPACVTERDARRETRYKFTPMCPSSAEKASWVPLIGYVARSRISNLEARISRLESRISNLGSPEMGLSTLYGTSRPLSHPLPQRTSLEISTSTLEM